MKNFAIRQAAIQDAVPIARVQVASWRSTYAGLLSRNYLETLDPDERSEQWQLRISMGVGTFLVAEDDSGIFGFLAGGSIRKAIQRYDAELYAIYLLREKQRLGAGQALVCQLAEELAVQGYQSMVVWILAENPSRGFYEHLGGIPVAQDDIEIGGEKFPEVAYGWPSLTPLKKRVYSQESKSP
jgi:L-amino acid N-acyltransferase YncA